MITRHSMLTIKIRAPRRRGRSCPRRFPRAYAGAELLRAEALIQRVPFRRFLSLLGAAALLMLAGCRPPGPRAALEGQSLLERGKYAAAIEKLDKANVLLGNTNAQVLNYLGLACQLGGQPAAAERAYRRALALDRELVEAHYNLGSLLLEQSKLEAARSELTAYTLKRPSAPEGWLQLGRAQLRLREASAAERSFSEAIRLKAQNPEAWTAYGLARLQRNRPAEAAQFFSKALAQQRDYAPALLNLAIVAQQNLHDRALALRSYKEYLGLKPSPENSEAIRAVIRELEQPISPPPAPPARPAALATPQATNNIAAKTPQTQAPKVERPAPLLAAAPTQSIAAPKPESPAPAQPKPQPPATGVSKPPPKPSSETTALEVTQLQPEPVFKSAEDINPGPAPTSPVRSPATSAPSATTNATKPGKRGLLTKLNPMKLFAGGSTPSAAPPVVSNTAPELAASTPATGTVAESTASAANFPRYTYRSPAKPPSGNRTEAQRWFRQAVDAQRAQRYQDAIHGYRQAIEADPGFFDAYYNLGLAASEADDTGLALSSYETALALRPEALDARYNFALVLKQEKYMFDAANELEKLLATYPNDSRSHLALGNLYAQELQQPARARQHYLKVLEVDPRNPQAPAIQYWLTRNQK